MHYNITNIILNHGFDYKNKEESIYINLYRSIQKAIMNRKFEDGFKLPPSRILAKDLSISRNTVVKAYDLLVLENYINSRQGSGYFVSPVENKKNQFKFNKSIKKKGYPETSYRAKSFSNNLQKNESDNKIVFRPGLPPLDIFPVQTWKNLSNKYWKTISGSKLSYSSCFGLKCLRQSISNYLKVYRNTNCHIDQIIITTGTLHSLSLISDALLNEGDEIILENATYPNALSLFKSLKPKIILAETDSEGIVINKVKCKKPKFVYTTPSNQYPTGIKMSLERRIKLLKWASDQKTMLIEDDYDHEFINWSNPISSIFSLDNEDRTVYLGTFNKLLHPSIRIGYMIVPSFLKNSIRGLYEKSSRFVSPSTQTILSYFIDKDYLNKHLRKVVEIASERKIFFKKYFESIFGNKIELDTTNSGLHLIGKLKPHINDVELSKHFRDKGVIVNPYSNYFIDNKNINGLVIGYASVDKKIIKQTILKMYDEYINFLNIKDHS